MGSCVLVSLFFFWLCRTVITSKDVLKKMNATQKRRSEFALIRLVTKPNFKFLGTEFIVMHMLSNSN